VYYLSGIKNMILLKSVAMKKISASVIITLITVFVCVKTNGQKEGGLSPEFRRNSINGYIGFAEYNINYERSIFQHPKSYTNLRMGFGYGAFITAGEGLYLNPAIVHLIGKKCSFLELDLGFKYMVQYDGLDPDYSKFFISDLFAGYRYERPDGKRIFRVGLNWPTLVNIGIGFKF
jgi:hypothetical protein